MFSILETDEAKSDLVQMAIRAYDQTGFIEYADSMIDAYSRAVMP